MTLAASSIATSASPSTVLKNTYRLLSLTLVWSAVTAFVGMQYPVTGWGALGILIAAFALLWATSANRNSGLGVLFVFAFTGLMGFSLGPTLNHYLGMANGAQVVGTSLLTTGAMFLGLSAYVQMSKKDFSFLGSFLLVALIGLIVVSLFNLFFPVAGLSLILAYVSALIFSGYILYDTSDIVSGRQTNYVMATVGLYLDILNLFLSLLRIFSGRN